MQQNLRAPHLNTFLVANLITCGSVTNNMDTALSQHLEKKLRMFLGDFLDKTVSVCEAVQPRGATELCKMSSHIRWDLMDEINHIFRADRANSRIAN